MTTTINASTSSGLVVSPDNSGNILLQYNGIATPAFRAYATGGQSIGNSTFTKITLNNKTFDTASAFDSTTNYRFTPLVAGYYQINGQVFMSGASAGYTQLAIYKNGSQFNYGSGIPNNTSVGGQAVVSDIVYLNGSTDYVELYGWQNSGGSLATYTGGTLGNYMSGCLLRGA
jgi:hypothetical protein